MEKLPTLDEHIAGHQKTIDDIKSRIFTVHGEGDKWVIRHGKYVFARTYCQQIANDATNRLETTVANIVADLETALRFAKEQCVQTSLKLFDKT
jgi:hypothetical protein